MKRVILCVDGPAPLSKQNQQRQRRYRSALESADNKLSNFDSNCITPGTKFMDYLTKYIDWYLRKRINESKEWQNVQVIFSNEKAPGEGEHKIINYIRYYGEKDDTYCINGLDADLIMLALGTHVPKFYILREDTYGRNGDLLCVDIGGSRKDLVKELDWRDHSTTSNSKSIFKFDKVKAINDFIFICFMVGNDFLPHIPSIEIIENGIELMIQVYRETCQSYGHITEYVDGNVRFCKKSLCAFLGTIGHHEKENFEIKLSKKASFFPDPLLESCAIQKEEGNWEIDIEKYKSGYVEKCFPDNTEEVKLCHDYLEGMQWVLSYYTRGVPNWKWNFRYHYAPFASNLAKHIDTFDFPCYGRTIPSTPFQQLLCVLPPKSAKLIPSPLSDLLVDEKSPLINFCPERFDIDLSGKRKEWEGIVLLPMVDFNLVRECYMKMLDKIDKKELKRNVFGRSVVYIHDNTLNRDFLSYYGNIERCKVKTAMIDL